jgi:hypothetical protein
MQTQPVSLRRSAKDSGASELLILLLGGTAAHLKRRPDRPASNSVHANTLGPELLGQRLDVVHAQKGRTPVQMFPMMQEPAWRWSRAAFIIQNVA